MPIKSALFLHSFTISAVISVSAIGFFCGKFFSCCFIDFEKFGARLISVLRNCVDGIVLREYFHFNELFLLMD